MLYEVITNTWALDGTPTFNDGGANGDLSFSGFAALPGGTGAHTFHASEASTFNLSGGAGADVFDIDATLTGSVAGGADSYNFV